MGVGRAGAIGGAIGVLYMAVGTFVGGWQSTLVSPPFSFSQMPPLDGQWAIVTGANTGIGFVTARELWRKGANVVFTVRSKEKGEATLERLRSSCAGAGALEYRVMDLGSLASVRGAGQSLAGRGNRYDMVVLNAGVMACDRSTTEDGLERQFATNHLGHMYLTRLLEPSLAEGSRIVVVSSIAHAVAAASPFDAADVRNPEKMLLGRWIRYGRSKMANILFARALARRLGGRAHVHSVHPGTVSTDLFRHTLGSSEPQARSALRFALDRAFLLTADDGAKTQLYAATMPEAQAGDPTRAKHWRPIAVQTFAFPPAGSVGLQDRLWAFSDAVLADFEAGLAPPVAGDPTGLHRGAATVLH